MRCQALDHLKFSIDMKYSNATISDCHCILEWKLSSRYQNNCAFNDDELYDKSPNYIWSDESAVKFQSALLSPDIQEYKI
jgi:hypothetical protein